MLKFDMNFNTCSIWFRDYDSGCGAYDHVGKLEKKKVLKQKTIGFLNHRILFIYVESI